MSEFIDGNIAVKTREQYAVVEASYQSKSFNRKFLLPSNINFDGIKAAMSDEGILTITAPKKVIFALHINFISGSRPIHTSMSSILGNLFQFKTCTGRKIFI